MAQNVLAVVPARLGSTRFPDKVIFTFKGHPLLYYIHRELSRCRVFASVVIATDSRKLARIAEGFGADVVLTSRRHRTGSDRVAEVASGYSCDVVVNIQADNFGLRASVLDKIVAGFQQDREPQFGTLARRITSDLDLFDPNKVKVAIGDDGDVLWFSRYPIPYVRDAVEKNRCTQVAFWEHIGIYLFRKEALLQYAGWKQSRHEKAESLEQLRILDHRRTIRVYKTRMKTCSVDTPDDLKQLKSMY